MKKSEKLMDALKAFEIENQELVNGGMLVVSWSWNNRCDIADTKTNMDVRSNIVDGGPKVGSSWY